MSGALIPAKITGPTDNGNTFCLWGDSKTANCNVGINNLPTAASRSGNVVTVAAATNLIQMGQTLKICNLMPDDFNGIYTPSSVSAGSFTYISPGTQGSAIVTGFTHPSGGGADIKILNSLSPNGMWLWLNGLMKGGLRLVANVARGGWTANYATIVIDTLENEITNTGMTAKNAYINFGINDVTQGRTAAQIIASLTTLAQHNTQLGRRVFLCTIEPYGSGHTSFTAAKNAIICEVNRWITNIAPQLLGIYPIDLYAVVVNPSNGSLRALLTIDAIHPDPAACMDYLAPAIFAEVSKYISTQSPLPKAIVDTYAASVNSSNKSDAGPWVTTSGGAIVGTVTPGSSGVIAGWTLQQIGAASSVAAQINTNAAGYVEQQFSFAGTVAAYDRAELFIPFLISGRLTAGDVQRVCFKLEVSNLDAANGNILDFGTYLELAAGGVTGYQYIGAYSSSVYPITGVLAGTKVFTMLSEPVVIPASLTTFKLHLRVDAAGPIAGSPAIFKISQIGIIPAW